MKLLSAATGKDWASLDPPSTQTAQDEVARTEAQNHRQKLDQVLTDILLSENLIVLCGLGTSLCLKNDKGGPVAPTMSDLWVAAQEQSGPKFDKVKAKVKYSTPDDGDNIELLLSNCQLSQTLQHNGVVANFISKTEALIVKKCRFVEEGINLGTHEAFLRKVARRSTRQPRMKLFTTNYDLCFETAASHTRFLVLDGFSHTQPQEFDGSYFSYDFVRRDEDRQSPDYIPNVFHFYKIHGSVDWELRNGQIIKTPQPPKPLIIYPRASKFESSYDQPFIEMMSRFQVALRQPNTGLFIVGFGFNDRHIVQPIMSAIRSNVSLKAVIVDPVLERCTKLVIRDIVSLIGNGDSRLVLLAAGFEELLPVLPDLVTATEEEQHRDRLRGLGGVR